MREYVAHEARSRLSTFSFSTLRQLVRNWRCRKQLLKLHGLDDFQLKEIGLTRSQLRHLSGLPLSVDPIWEAERLKLWPRIRNWNAAKEGYSHINHARA